MSLPNPEFDPNEPFIASDGLEYASLADKLLGSPLDSWRNVEISTRRAQGQSEAVVRAWIARYDGADYTPGSCPTPERRDRAWYGRTSV